MFLVHEIVQTELGQVGSTKDHLIERSKRLAQRPGFKSGQVCRFLGNIRIYMVLDFWEDRAAFEKWQAAAPENELLTGRPRGMYAIKQTPKYWEMELDLRGDAQGPFLNRGFLQVDAGKWDAFIAQRREHDAAGLTVGGIHYFQTYRYVGEPMEGGNDHVALILARRRSFEDYERFVDAPAIRGGDDHRLYHAITPDSGGQHTIMSEIPRL